MRDSIFKKHDQTIAIIFGVLTIAFIFLMTNQEFFNWAFKRHQNQLSWYSRPLFLIPYCYFAFKKSWAGVMISLFALLTSMFWLPVPEQVDENVQEFLAFEKQYLTSNWGASKIALALTVPISLFLLAMGFWKRNVWVGLSVIVLMAAGKIIWSVKEAGESGQSILVPAILGLLITSGVVIYGLYRGRLSKSNH